MLKLDPDKEIITLLNPSTVPAIRAWNPQIVNTSANILHINVIVLLKTGERSSNTVNIRTPASKTSCHSTSNQVPQNCHTLCIYLLIQMRVFYFLPFSIISFLFYCLSNFVSNWNILYLFLWYSILNFRICRRKFFL